MSTLRPLAGNVFAVLSIDDESNLQLEKAKRGVGPAKFAGRHYPNSSATSSAYDAPDPGCSPIPLCGYGDADNAGVKELFRFCMIEARSYESNFSGHRRRA
jgi:hypothetical protein